VAPVGLVGDEREGLKDSFESPPSVAISLVPDLGKIIEVAGDLAFVPCE
jgi:hypothetical protein